jgi:hypothetical protein
MKIPTTPYSIALQEKWKITREFLLSEGWVLKNEYPLFETFEHSKNADLVCSIGLYGSFSLCELHWCNKTPDREFSTINSELTKDDYYQVIKLLGIRMLNSEQNPERSVATEDDSSIKAD